MISNKVVLSDLQSKNQQLTLLHDLSSKPTLGMTLTL
jgi:hypothetical protein